MNLGVTHAECASAHVSLQFATMLRFTSRQRKMVIGKVPDLANLTFRSMVVGQFLTDRPFSLRLALIGFGVWAVLAIFAPKVAGDE